VIKVFSIITSVFRVTWSYRNYFNMMLKKHLWLLAMLKNSYINMCVCVCGV